MLIYSIKSNSKLREYLPWCGLLLIKQIMDKIGNRRGKKNSDDISSIKGRTEKLSKVEKWNSFEWYDPVSLGAAWWDTEKDAVADNDVIDL